MLELRSTHLLLEFPPLFVQVQGLLVFLGVHLPEQGLAATRLGRNKAWPQQGLARLDMVGVEQAN